MNSLNEKFAGGKFRLLQRSFSLDIAENFRVHDGMDTERNSKVKVLLASNDVDPARLDELILYFRERGLTDLDRGGYQQRQYVAFAYVEDASFERLFEQWEKGVELQVGRVEAPPQRLPAIERPVPSTTLKSAAQPKATRNWSVVLAGAVLLILLALGALAIPSIISIINPTATPTITASPTPLQTPTPTPTFISTATLEIITATSSP